jgi:hypothetical protein
LFYKPRKNIGKLCWCPKMALLEKQLLLSSINNLKQYKEKREIKKTMQQS